MRTTNEEIDETGKLRSNDNNTVENVRVELREATLTTRKQNRTSAWSKNRKNLGECLGNELFSIEYVIERIKLLKKKRITLEDYRYLPNALIQSEENIYAFLRVDQSLSGLIRDLSGNNSTLQLYAANCCCNIALGNTKACTALGKAIIPYLLIELESLNYILLDVCIWTIGNLVAGSNVAFSVLHAQHCLKYLILLLSNCDDSILPSIIYALLHYVHMGFYEISKNDMAQLVQVIIKRNFLYENSDFIWLLALLSSSTICTTYLHSILPQIVDHLYLLFFGSDEIAHVNEITASIRILANTLYNSCEDKTDILLRNSKYSHENLCLLLNKLLSHQYMHIRRETLWLIGNLYNHRSPSVGKNIRDLVAFLPALNQAFLSVANCA
ncbi:transmembrane and coiled-coil domain-containing protein 6 [Polyergus mexicanus]|uniref:transmembrane and coiled-coil domain-containing protein 6 n=1 Tax=Polyergus mexicanus TaxID=615972 RepID=UPI0038B568DD